jgi:CubicO group peptidase (beta-lactamase class C family)
VTDDGRSNARTAQGSAADDRTGSGRTVDAGLTARLERALGAVRAPDVVLAVSRGGRRTVVSGGTAPAPGVPREAMAYEIGSLSKTFTVLLLAELTEGGLLSLDDPLAAHLPGPRPADRHARLITLRHLATHTAGLPRVPRDLIAGALLHPYANGYAGYDRARLLRTFARTRVRHAPGTRRHYSNFGLALLGSALEHAAGADFADLLADRVLRPLSVTADGPRSTGRKADGRTPLPPADMGVFAPAGGLRATPADLLTYAEAHLDPDAAAPASLARALREVRVPLLRVGVRHRHTHTLTWYRHPAPGGPLLFHAGATFGHQSFLGYHPATSTAVAAVSTRYDRTCALVGAAYGLLRELCGGGSPI